MDRRPHSFLEQFHSMDTHLLLQRYRTGGLVPEAEAALRTVLESRGYSQEKLAQRETPDPASNESRPTSSPGRAAQTPQIPDSHPRLRPFNIVLKCLITPVVVIFVLFAIPLLGNFVVVGGAALLGCQTGEDNIHPCHFLGMDAGELIYGYIVDIFMLGAFNPVLAFLALGAFVRSPLGIIWWLTAGGVLVAREIMRRRLRAERG